MKTLTNEQAAALYAFTEAFDRHITGAWSTIEQVMVDDFDIEDPTSVLEQAKGALLEARQVRNETAEADRPLEPDFATMATEIHTDNVLAGWWSDTATGESTLNTRNRPEMLMLAVSELAEAAEGVKGLMDDKLPHLPMYDVELADFVIRQFDQIGAEMSCGAEIPDWAHLATWESDLFSAMPSRSELLSMSRDSRLLQLVKSVSAAMEHYRKGRIGNYVRTMAEGVLLAFIIAKIEKINLLDIIAQKRAFNKTRADHQIENRLKDGGKKF